MITTKENVSILLGQQEYEQQLTWYGALGGRDAKGTNISTPAIKRIVLRSTKEPLLLLRGVCSRSVSASTAPRVGRIRGRMKQIWKFDTFISPVTDNGSGAAAAVLREVLESPGDETGGEGGGIPRKV